MIGFMLLDLFFSLDNAVPWMLLLNKIVSRVYHMFLLYNCVKNTTFSYGLMGVNFS